MIPWKRRAFLSIFTVRIVILGAPILNRQLLCTTIIIVDFHMGFDTLTIPCHDGSPISHSAISMRPGVLCQAFPLLPSQPSPSTAYMETYSHKHHPKYPMICCRLCLLKTMFQQMIYVGGSSDMLFWLL